MEQPTIAALFQKAAETIFGETFEPDKPHKLRTVQHAGGRPPRHKLRCSLALRIAHRRSDDRVGITRDARETPREIAQALWEYVVEQMDGSHETLDLADYVVNDRGRIDFNLVVQATPLPPRDLSLDLENDLLYHNWLRVGLAIREAVKGLGGFAHARAKALHEKILALGLLQPDSSAIESKYQGVHSRFFQQQLPKSRETLEELEKDFAAEQILVAAGGSPSVGFAERRKKLEDQRRGYLVRNGME